jgi:hypothetical protein
MRNGYLISSRNLLSGTKYDGTINLPFLLYSGTYEVTEFIATNTFPNVIETDQILASYGTTFTIPEGLYTGQDLETALQTLFDASIWTTYGGTVTYDPIVNTMTFAYVNATLEGTSFSVVNDRLRQILNVDDASTLYKNVVFDSINLSPLYAIFLNIEETSASTWFDASNGARDILLTPNLTGQTIVWRHATHGYPQYFTLRENQRNLNIKFTDEFGMSVDQGDVDWTLIIRKCNCGL